MTSLSSMVTTALNKNQSLIDFFPASIMCSPLQGTLEAASIFLKAFLVSHIIEM